MFTGRRYDNETGLYYYRALYYSPKIGRFLQTDPIGYYGGLNLYMYVLNNPVNWVDPWEKDTLGIHAKYGHAWITYIHDSGHTQTFGLWHISRAMLKSGGHRFRPGSDLWRNIEKSNTNIYKPIASRYYNNLTKAQIQSFKKWISTPHKYK